MSTRLSLLIILLIILALIVKENMTKRPEQLHVTSSGQVEMCLSCHTTEKLDAAHDTKMLGCSPCHLGDALAIDKETAHKGIVNNPGDLRVVEKTCGIEGCHAADVKKVKNSLMATNRGILATLLHYWGEAPDQNGDFSVEKLLESGDNSLALDYYRKLCATCHLWKQKGDLPGFFGEKGGGCTACHFIKDATLDPEAAKKIHPLITKKVPASNCVRCHNRSGRIGISYTGVYESENYGTPYEEGEMSSQELPGNRFYLNISDDIHHRQGMACIDCHTRNEIMGDGTNYAHYEEAVEIECHTCHNRDQVGITRKNQPLNNVVKQETGYVLQNKITDQLHPLKPPKAGVCDFQGHNRLGCDSCHSTWVPQCYGCHVKYDRSDTDLDKLTMEQTPGWWSEGRSYIRYERPTLAVWADQVVIVTPGCQDIITLLDEEGGEESQFNSFTMAAISPHTTQAKGRSCEECHTEPKVLGLGEGRVWKEDGQWNFSGLDQGVETAVGTTPPLDAFVSIDGKQLQRASRPDLRPFNKKELGRILRIGQCIECHGEYTDPAWKNYTPQTRCPVFTDEG
ncbi:MAG: hypothetical protein RI601_05125 [Desulfurivibrionaceae bacterium]|nr:hypothetical protein [Desulfurivibrionaceae bacterium]